MSGRRVLGVEGALLLREQLAQRSVAADGGVHARLVVARLERRRADEAARHRVDLDGQPRRRAQLLGQLVGNDRPQLDDGVVGLALTAPCADDEPGLVENQVGRVEEEDLADLALQRVEVERRDRRALVALGDRQLELDAVGLADQCEHLRELGFGEPVPC